MLPFDQLTILVPQPLYEQELSERLQALNREIDHLTFISHRLDERSRQLCSHAEYLSAISMTLRQQCKTLHNHSEF